MSIFYYLLLFSLCLSLLHACNARHLGTINKKKLQKNEEKVIDKVPVLPETNDKSTLSNELGGTRGDRNKETTNLDDESQKMKDKKANHQKISKNDHETETISGNKDVKVSVSWRLPRSKRGKKYPGFDSDYSPPKTHPPSHN